MGLIGIPASVESVAACAAKGIDIRGHKSSALSDELIRESDLIFAMSGTHQAHIISMCPEAIGKCFLLAEDKEVSDPIGQSQAVYNDCAEVIDKAVRKIIGGLWT